MNDKLLENLIKKLELMPDDLEPKDEEIDDASDVEVVKVKALGKGLDEEESIEELEEGSDTEESPLAKFKRKMGSVEEI